MKVYINTYIAISFITTRIVEEYRYGFKYKR